jgi:hypothetical protein
VIALAILILLRRPQCDRGSRLARSTPLERVSGVGRGSVLTRTRDGLDVIRRRDFQTDPGGLSVHLSESPV